jgi:hypothetical protein
VRRQWWFRLWHIRGLGEPLRDFGEAAGASFVKARIGALVYWEALHSLHPFLLFPVFLLSCLLPAVRDFGLEVFHEVLRLRLGE